jgi:hypothetical protein
MAKVPLDADRIFSQTVSGQPKSEVLAMLQERHPGTQYHFIEDKMGTLEKVGVASNPDGIARRRYSSWRCICDTRRAGAWHLLRAQKMCG